jgi:hypothetical protein
MTRGDAPLVIRDLMRDGGPLSSKVGEKWKAAGMLGF